MSKDITTRAVRFIERHSTFRFRLVPQSITFVAVFLLATNIARAQDIPSPDFPQLSRQDQSRDTKRTEMYTALTDTKISVNFENLPIRDVIEKIASHLTIPVLGRYSDDPIGYGIDPEIQVTAFYKDVNVLTILEDVLFQVSRPGDVCTWQIRRGFLEIGNKSRLSVPAASERRTYYIRDVMLSQDQSMMPGAVRVPPDAIALDLIELIVTTIEPDMWDWGQIDYESIAPPAPIVMEPATGAAVTDDGTHDRRINPKENPAANPSNAPSPRYIQREKPAIIRHWRDVIIVDAPDFVHRQIRGYGRE